MFVDAPASQYEKENEKLTSTTTTKQQLFTLTSPQSDRTFVQTMEAKLDWEQLLLQGLYLSLSACCKESLE
jgi:hypothetical protein